MARFHAIAALAFVVLAAGHTHAGGEKDIQIKGTLSKDDPRDKERGGPSKTHAVKMKAGTRYTIDMMAPFDSFLRLLDQKGMQLEEDDDSGGGNDARILFNCSRDGDYTIVCTSFDKDGQGNYTLTVVAGQGNPKPVSAHAQMLGKPAPDVQGNFAVNGKAVKLTDFKGKVVLLHFTDVRSSGSLALLPRLNEWKKAHHADGLAIVAVTFYPSDIGQRLGIDMETGKLKTVAKADRKSDQALLTAFAAHHKIDYPLLALSKQNALDTFDAYVVNGYPQLVLIDRAGVARLIDVGGEKSSPNVESEIKKLLGAK